MTPLKTVKIVATDSSPMRKISVLRYSLHSHLHTAGIGKKPGANVVSGFRVAKTTEPVFLNKIDRPLIEIPFIFSFTYMDVVFQIVCIDICVWFVYGIIQLVFL
jgi:hypothetical protein